MRTTALWSALAATTLVIAGTPSAFAALPTDAASTTASQAAEPGATAAGQWLAGQLVDGAMPGFAGPDWGLTIDTQWALTAAEADPDVVRSVVDAVQTHVPDYAGPGWYPDPEARIAGATAKILVSAVVAGRDYRDFGGRNMRQETLDLIAGPDAGVEEGRLRDKATGNDDTNMFSQSLAVIGLARSGGVSQPVVDFLLRQQCSEGYFRMFYNDKLTCDAGDGAPDGDGTAMAVQALMTAQAYGVGGVDTAIYKALDWMVSVQKPDGSFGGGVSTEGSNSNSTGLVAQALAGGGRDAPAAAAKAWVANLQLSESNAGGTPAAPHLGTIAYNAESMADALANGIDLGIDQWRRATAQAVFALAPVPFSELQWNDPNPPTEPPTPTVTVTATETATATSTVTQKPPTVTQTQPARPPVTRTAPGKVTTLRPPPLPRATTTRTHTVVVMPTAPGLPRATSTITAPGATSTVTATPQPTVNATAPAAERTIAYLQSQLTSGNRVEVVRDGARYVDYDGTVDLALALRQAGKQPGTIGAIASLMSQPDAVAAYAHGAPYDDQQARYAGPLAKLTLLLALSTKDAVGNDLAGELAGRIQPDGRLTDQSKQGDQSNLVSQAYGVLALTASGKTEEAKRATEAMLRQQCGDGSFPAQFGPAEQRCQTGDLVSTALAVQALNAKHGDTAPTAPEGTLSRAVKALNDRQDTDGAWANGWQQNGQPNVPGTAAAITALQSAGVDTAAARERMTAAIRPDGSLPVQPGGVSDRPASVTALPALAGGSLLTADKAVLDRAATAPFTTEPDPKNVQAVATTNADFGPWPAWAGSALLLVAVGALTGWLVARRRGAHR